MGKEEGINNKSLRKLSWELRELKEKRARMELGVIEATQEDYDRICKRIEELENYSELKDFIKKESDLPLLILKYDFSEDDELFTCEFEIGLPDNVDELEKKIFEVKEWVDRRIPYARKKCCMDKKEKIITLVIKGKGHDGRCKWCRSFRTSLKEFLSENELAGIRQNNFCRFDK